MDRKVVIFIICLLVVFGVFAQVGFCNGGDGKKKDPCEGVHCPGHDDLPCDDECSGEGSPSSVSTITYYSDSLFPEYVEYSSDYYYGSPPSFIDRIYYTYDCVKRKNKCCCTGKKNCDKCESTTISCKEWQKCYISSIFSGCKCDEERCEAFCIKNAPVYDGDQYSGCSKPSSTEKGKYRLEIQTNKGYKNCDWDPESGKCWKRYYCSEKRKDYCYCGFFTIKNRHECDDAFINDSHPCASGNCAPSFEGGRAVCLPDKKCWWDKDGDGIYDDDEIFDENREGEHYTIAGYNLTCKNGKWFFKLDDNAGETIAIELWNNTLNAYPKEWERDQKKVYWGVEQVIVFKLTENRDIFVYTNPKRPKGKKVYIEVYKCPSEGDAYLDNCGSSIESGTDEIVLENQPRGWYMVKLRSNVNQPGYKVNVTVDTFLPEAKKVCSGRERECAPLSYCVLDNINYLLSPGRPENYYCCPIGTCYYNWDCYSEGMVKLNVRGEVCNWKCENGKFRKLEVGEVCMEDCECRLPGNNDFGCSQVLQNQSKKVCCPIKDGKKGCAIEGKVMACVEDGVAYINEKDGGLYVCNNGTWEGGLWVLKKVEVRILLKGGEIFNTSFSIEKPLVNSTLYIFYDDPLGGGEVRYSVNGNDWDLVPEDMTIKLGSLEKGTLNVSVRLERGSFVFVDGIVLYGEG